MSPQEAFLGHWNHTPSLLLQWAWMHFIHSTHHAFHSPCLHQRPFLPVHSYNPNTQNWYLAQQKPLIHFCWENKINKLLSNGAERITIPINSKNAHFLSFLNEVIFLENSSNDGMLLDPHCTWPQGESTRPCSHRTAPASGQRHGPLQPGVLQRDPSKVLFSHWFMF